MRAVLAALLLSLVVVPATVAQDPLPRSVAPNIADGSAARSLERAKERWRSARIPSYSFEVRRSCFCPPTGFRRMVVIDGSPRRPPAAFTGVATVPRLLRLIARAIDGRYSGLRVTYGTHGVPSAIALDPESRIADEETSYSVRRFRRR